MLVKERTAPGFTVVGKRLRRVDALTKVTGAAIYSGDVQLPGMLYGKILRSPYPHARVKRLDTTKARALEGVKAIAGYVFDRKGRRMAVVCLINHPNAAAGQAVQDALLQWVYARQ